MREVTGQSPEVRAELGQHYGKIYQHALMPLVHAVANKEKVALLFLSESVRGLLLSALEDFEEHDAEGQEIADTIAG